MPLYLFILYIGFIDRNQYYTWHIPALLTDLIKITRILITAITLFLHLLCLLYCGYFWHLELK